MILFSYLTLIHHFQKQNDLIKLLSYLIHSLIPCRPNDNECFCWIFKSYMDSWYYLVLPHWLGCSSLPWTFQVRDRAAATVSFYVFLISADNGIPYVKSNKMIFFFTGVILHCTRNNNPKFRVGSTHCYLRINGLST